MFPLYLDDEYIDQMPIVLKAIKDEGIRMVNHFYNGPDHFNVTFFNEDDAVTIKMMLL